MRGAIASRKLATQERRMRSSVLLRVTKESLWSGRRMATLLSRVIRKMVLIETKVHPANTGPITMQGCQGLGRPPRRYKMAREVEIPWYQMGGALVTIREISV